MMPIYPGGLISVPFAALVLPLGDTSLTLTPDHLARLNTGQAEIADRMGAQPAAEGQPAVVELMRGRGQVYVCVSGGNLTFTSHRRRPLPASQSASRSPARRSTPRMTKTGEPGQVRRGSLV
jgi:hypothetical protein